MQRNEQTRLCALVVASFLACGSAQVMAQAAPAPAGSCDPDFDGTLNVNIFDLIQLFSAWGPCPGCPQDITGDGQIDVFDLVLLLDCWGDCPCPALGADEVFDTIVVVDATNLYPEAADLGLIVAHMYASGAGVIDGDKLLTVAEAALTPIGSTFYQDPFGGDTPPTSVFCPLIPSVCYDTFVTNNLLIDDADNTLLSPAFSMDSGSITGDWFAVTGNLAVDIPGNPGQTGILIAQVTLDPLPGLAAPSSVGFGGTLILFNGSAGAGGGGGGGGGVGEPISFSFVDCPADLERFQSTCSG